MRELEQDTQDGCVLGTRSLLSSVKLPRCTGYLLISHPIPYTSGESLIHDHPLCSALLLCDQFFKLFEGRMGQNGIES